MFIHLIRYNLSTPERRELVWDIITNKEAIQVNQIWAGHPGHQALVRFIQSAWCLWSMWGHVDRLLEVIGRARG